MIYSQSLGCIWTGGQCPSLTCSQATNSSICNIKSNCIWNYTNNSCINFTSCRSTPIKTQGTCSGLSQTQCTTYEQNNIGCAWYNNQCARGDCTMLSTQSDCNSVNADPYYRICTWAANSCRQSVCTDLSQSVCSQIIDMSNYSSSNCIWYNGTCFSPTSAQLSSNLCSLTSGFTYVYKNSTGICTQCQGQQDGKKLFMFILILLQLL